MKKILFTIISVVLFIGTTLAQKDSLRLFKSQEDVKTLFDFSKIKNHGVFMSVGFGVGFVGGAEHYEVSYNPAWLINHKYAIGFEVTNFVTEVDDLAFMSDEVATQAEFSGNKYGFFFSPIFFPLKPIHFSIPVTIGGAYVNAYNYETDPNNIRYLNGSDSDGFFFIKPGVELELNLHKFVRLGLKVQYSYALGVDLNHNNENNKNSMNGVIGGLSLKVGLF